MRVVTTALVATFILATRPANADVATSSRELSRLYLRVGAGASAQKDRVDIGTEVGTVTGVGQSFELAAGWAVSPRLVLGLAAEYDVGLSRNVDFASVEVSAQDSYLILTLGPFATWYPATTLDWSVTAGAGWGVTTAVSSVGQERGGSFGLGAFAGVGREWRVSDGWSIGGSLRAQIARTTDFDPVADLLDIDKGKHRALGLGLMFTGSYN